MRREKSNSVEAVRLTSAPIWRGKIVLVVGSDVELLFYMQKNYKPARHILEIL